jgi:hypothetical protein
MTKSSIKVFNTVGPCIPEAHYMLPVLPRIPDIDDMIADKFYFLIHAPRQSGKTTYLQFLTNKINSEGQFYAIYCSLMSVRGINNRNEAITTVLAQINEAMDSSEVELIKNKAFSYNSLPGMDEPSLKVKKLLTRLCKDLNKDLIVFFDEADCLSAEGLITFLAQIRDGYNIRSQTGNKFPRSIALVGMRDIRDYLVQAREGASSTSIASPFNVKKEAFTLSNFTQDEIGVLYHQHTEASGQVFDDDAIQLAYYWSQGQPWLVNALAYETVIKILKKDYQKPVTKELIDEAAERLIKRRDTHIDSLLERLKEPRVRRVMEPVILGSPRFSKEVTDDDKQYVIDLGILTNDDDVIKPANPIYNEVILRTLSQRYQDEFPKEFENKWMDGLTLNMTALLKNFQEFWRENADMIDNPYDYNESVPHFVLFGFLQRVLNGGAEKLSREYALGRMRLDINVRYKDRSYPLELKIKPQKNYENLKRKDFIKQILSYMKICGADEGWLVIFDRNPETPWDDKIFWNKEEHEGKTIHIVGC